jgi:gamma-glutamylcyclotransferase (GGCT)/AIG2-like uncharacterized protein YtfP
MNKNSLYAFYGSLRRGMSNYERYKEALNYKFSARLKGYKLYSMGQYPCIIKSPESHSVHVEIFKITNSTLEKQIHEMELEEGYAYKDIIIDGNEIGIYFFNSFENFREVPGGDWVTFFRQNSK